MSKDQNFISQLKISLDKKNLENTKYILEGHKDFDDLDDKDFYLVCYAFNFTKNYENSNLLIQKRKKNIYDLELKKKNLRLEIFNFFYSQNASAVQTLSKLNLKIGFDAEIVKVFYLSLKNIKEYSEFLVSIYQSLKENEVMDKDLANLLSFFRSHNELRIHAHLLIKMSKKARLYNETIKNLAINYFQLKKYYLAKKYYEKLVKINSTNELLLELAVINNILRKKKDSENCIKLALQNNPKDLRALYYMLELEDSDRNKKILLDAFLTVEKNKFNGNSLPKDLFYFYLSKVYEKKK